ncbi:hypothetical protein K7G98_41490, partial [Saccharothrix sp. MB29]|nr:hypothetical protein [Saccharothrix sp. MB29]
AFRGGTPRLTAVPGREVDHLAVTAIPDGRGVAALLLICDDCGRGYGGDSGREEWVVLWHKAVAGRWAGPGPPGGPHPGPTGAGG